MDAGGTPNFAHDAGLVEGLALATIELHDAVARDALPEVLVGRADQDLLDPIVGGGDGRRRGDASSGSYSTIAHVVTPMITRRLHHGCLAEQLGRHPLARLVPRPQVVAKALDHVVGRHAHVRRPFPQQLERE